MEQRLGHMMDRYIADTNILILHFAGKLPATLPSLLGISIISEIELFSYPKLTLKDRQQLKSILSDIKCFPLSTSIKEKTIQLRHKYSIKIPDAIICATAVIQNAVLLTNDKQLLSLAKVRTKSLGINT